MFKLAETKEAVILGKAFLKLCTTNQRTLGEENLSALWHHLQRVGPPAEQNLSAPQISGVPAFATEVSKFVPA